MSSTVTNAKVRASPGGLQCRDYGMERSDVRIATVGRRAVGGPFLPVLASLISLMHML